jgi:hypothetical protein
MTAKCDAHIVMDLRLTPLPQVKSNRDNGDYATGDLYERHPIKDNVWKYAGRGDDVVVLVSRKNQQQAPELTSQVSN